MFESIFSFGKITRFRSRKSANYVLGGVPVLRHHYRSINYIKRYLLVGVIIVGLLLAIKYALGALAIFFYIKQGSSKFGANNKYTNIAVVLCLMQFGLMTQFSSWSPFFAVPEKSTPATIQDTSQVKGASTDMELKKLQDDNILKQAEIDQAKAKTLKLKEDADKIEAENKLAQDKIDAQNLADALVVQQAEEVRLQKLSEQAAIIKQQAAAKPVPVVQTYAVPAKTSTNCHPSYTPCIPNGPDLNCPEVRSLVGSVRVIGPDSYSLDRDKDGIGCE
jgi:uncharacterized membrane protein